jgi:hypothetical protein
MRTPLPADLTINIAFGLFMAVLGLLGIYQAARYTARQLHHRDRESLHISPMLISLMLSRRINHAEGKAA